MCSKVIVPKTAVIVFLAMIKVFAMSFAVIETRPQRFLFLTFARLCWRVKSFKQTITVIVEIFQRLKSRIKPKQKQHYIM